MKTFIIFLLFLGEFLLLLFLITFLWYLSDKGIQIPSTDFLHMLQKIFIGASGIVLPIGIGIYIGNLISKAIN